MNDFAKRLKELREEKGISQVTLAKDTGISRAVLGFYERGLRCPSLDVVIILANYFKVSLDYLAGLED